MKQSKNKLWKCSGSLPSEKTQVPIYSGQLKLATALEFFQYQLSDSDPHWAEIHMELRKKDVTRHLLWEEYCQRSLSGRTATRSSAVVIRPSTSSRNAPCVSSISPVKSSLSTTAALRCRLSRQKPVNAARHRSSWRFRGRRITPGPKPHIRSRCRTGYSATSGCWSSSAVSLRSWSRTTSKAGSTKPVATIPISTRPTSSWQS